MHCHAARTRRASTRSVRPLAALAACVLAVGCQPSAPPPPEPPDPIPGYVLTLQPRFVAGTEPLRADADVSLVVVHDGDTDVARLGTVGDDALSLPELPLLVAGDIVGLLVETPGGSDDAWDPELTLAYGQVTLAEDLPTDGGTVELDVLVPPADSLPSLGVMENRRLAAAAAMAPGGDVFVFGGVDPARAFSGTAAASRFIYVLEGTDDGTTDMVRSGANLPEASFTGGLTDDRYVASAAVLVDDEDGPRILVAGGRVGYLDVDKNTDAAWLFDPVVQDWVMDGDAPLALKTANPMSGARPLLLDSGDVLFYGGTIDVAVLPGAVQFYDTSRRRFREINLTGDGGADFDPSAASLGPLGALVCGGANLSQDVFVDPWPAIDTCLRIGLDESVTVVAPLPEPRSQHAMVRLADGKVLATGGMADQLVAQLDQDPPTAATDAWLYDPDNDSWRSVGSLQRPRSGHAMVALPNGDALLIGGATGTGALFGKTGLRESCWERYDAATESFVLGECNGVGDGIYPQLSSHPGDGTFVLSGHQDDYAAVSVSGTYGLIATGLP